ncbi:hypothetical protein [Nannocystis punicea]|uniref:Uncharacterized protein n=1 Tax=Nannocystis punicea TaxID=2995304 RepID=A0ABY7HA52_9BACT|nr:hypothetical protein [Nannocystis poenicansa]WAS95987.1 hypothetical protein O0S08_07460 [Nannocystis poenicansa]
MSFETFDCKLLIFDQLGHVSVRLDPSSRFVRPVAQGRGSSARTSYGAAFKYRECQELLLPRSSVSGQSGARTSAV